MRQAQRGPQQRLCKIAAHVAACGPVAASSAAAAGLAPSTPLDVRVCLLHVLLPIRAEEVSEIGSFAVLSIEIASHLPPVDQGLTRGSRYAWG